MSNLYFGNPARGGAQFRDVIDCNDRRTWPTPMRRRRR